RLFTRRAGALGDQDVREILGGLPRLVPLDALEFRQLALPVALKDHFREAGRLQGRLERRAVVEELMAPAVEGAVDLEAVVEPLRGRLSRSEAVVRGPDPVEVGRG